MSHSTESLDLKRWESNSTVTEAESLNVSSHEMMGINKWAFSRILQNHMYVRKI